MDGALSPAILHVEFAVKALEASYVNSWEWRAIERPGSAHAIVSSCTLCRRNHLFTHSKPRYPDVYYRWEQGAAAGVLEPHEPKLTSTVFRLDDMRATAVMTPRPDVVFVDLSAPSDQALAAAIESGHSRFPVLRGGRDDVAGVLHIKIHTLAGFLMTVVQRVPKTGDSFDWRNYRFEVADMDRNRVDKILVTRARHSDTRSIDQRP